MLSDDEIARMTTADRRALILRLRSPVEAVVPEPERLVRLRRLRMALTVGGSVALVPWTVYLAQTLPARVTVDNWQAVWVGYDVLLLGMLAFTAWLGWRRRQALVLVAFGTGVLVLADAWFDVMTSSRFDTWVSVATAVFVEIPVAVLLMATAVRVLKLTMLRFLLLPGETSLWQLPLVVLDEQGAPAPPPLASSATPG